MKVFKRVLRPERLRQVPEQFSWVDQALVQHHLIDRLDAQAALLYLFLVTVADAQGLSYYGGATLAPPSAPHSAPMSAPPPARQTTGPVSLGDLLGQLERRRARL